MQMKETYSRSRYIKIYNALRKFNLKSPPTCAQAKLIITNDTGLML